MTNNMTNYIYLVAGERNTKPGAVSDSGGLYANVGMTHNGRLPEDRFRDPDYKKKQSGGNWVLLKQWAVADMKDHSIHNFLKHHDDVRWDPISHNTEEFLFIGDEGDGLKAVDIIEHIMLEHLMPAFVKEMLDDTRDELIKERNKREQIENAEPWVILQEALVQQEEAFKVEHDNRMKALENDNNIHLTLKEAELRNTVDTRLNEAITEAKGMVELAQKEVKVANDNANDLARQRDQALAKSKSRTRLSVLSMALGFVCSLSLGAEAFSNMTSDKVALAEYQIERSSQAVLASNNKVKDLEMEISRLTRENSILKQTLTEHQQKTVKEQSAKANLHKKEQSAKANLHKQICLEASSCVGDSQDDNSFVCSVYKADKRYQCKYTVEDRLSYGFGDLSFTVTLANGNASGRDYHGYKQSYKIVKYEAYGIPQ